LYLHAPHNAAGGLGPIVAASFHIFFGGVYQIGEE
jgi:hypothetical protein